MKVLHLLQSPHFSGAENVVCQIIGMFGNDANYEMAYCSQNGPIKEALAERNIPFYPMTKLKTSEVRRVIEAYKPDVIHAHDMRASFVAALCCGKIPLVSHIHNNAFDSRGISLKSIAYMLAAWKAKHIFWVSQSSLDGYAFHKLFKTKSTVLYNIIDVDALYEKMTRDTKKYDYDVTYIGRLTYQKNPQRLMCVCRLLKEKMPDAKIAVVGTGDLEEETKALAKEYDLLNNVEFLGFQSNPLKILHDSKAMLMTSRWEGTPMCALEAQSLGVPIVSTPTDGLCEVVADGVTGFLSDDDDILADKLCALMTHEDLRQKMGVAAEERMMQMMDKQMYVEAIKKAYD